MLSENVPSNPSPDQPHERPYDPPQPDPQALNQQAVDQSLGGFTNRRNWRGYLCAANRPQTGGPLSVAAGWLRNR